MKKYSGQGQDLWVLEKLNYKKNGYFIDIGAHDGISNSNTYLLEKDFNWTGICIEPNPLLRSYQSLIKNRKCICINCAIYNKNDELDFIARGRHPELSGLVDENSGKHVLDKYISNHGTIKVKTKTLNTLLKENNSPKQIDFLSLDTEGSEFSILESFDFSYRFNIIIVEHNYYDGSKDDIIKSKLRKDNIFTLLTKHNYKRIYSYIADDYYINNEIN